MRRIGWLVLACALALSTLISALTLAELHDHDCTGDDCPTCLVLCVAQAMLGAASTPAATASTSTATFALAALVVAAWVLLFSAETPVSNRVRLLI